MNLLKPCDPVFLNAIGCLQVTASQWKKTLPVAMDRPPAACWIEHDTHHGWTCRLVTEKAEITFTSLPHQLTRLQVLNLLTGLAPQGSHQLIELARKSSDGSEPIRRVQ